MNEVFGSQKFGWLIEKIDHNFGHYWVRVLVPGSGHYPGELGWTNDANFAIRFSRQEDAMAFMAMHPLHCVCCVPVEHGFITRSAAIDAAMAKESK